MKIKYFLFLYYLSASIICGMSSTEISFSGTFFAEKNIRFHNNVASDIKSRSVTECVTYCLNEHRKQWNSCHGVNFYKPNRTCEINAYHPTPGGNVIVYGWTFWKLNEIWGTLIDCSLWYTAGYTQSGVYALHPSNTYRRVFCDQETDGGGWTVFQNRFDGSVDFYRNWTDYKTGFGDPYAEYWIGNEMLHKLTSINEYELRIDLTSFSYGTAYTLYNKFNVADESDDYRLTASEPSGTAGDCLSEHNGMKFTTYDDDNDILTENCAKSWHGGWWYRACHVTNLNGPYTGMSNDNNPDSMSWSASRCTGVNSWPFDNHRTMKMSQMKIRPLGFDGAR